MAVQAALTPLQIVLQKLKPHQKILAVSKLQTLEKIRSLHQQGQIDFGENYVQEALEKIEVLQSLNLRWHLIGPLQKNKVKYLGKKFELIHSVNSLELAQIISEKSMAHLHQQKVLIQINLSGEPSKSGFDENSFKTAWDELKKLRGLQILGLMTMPPLQNEPAQNRSYFQKLVALGHEHNLKEFSMGTSHDYEIALQEGATWVRLGTTLFGERATRA